MNLKNKTFSPLYLFLLFFSAVTAFLWYLNKTSGERKAKDDFIIIEKDSKFPSKWKEMINPLNMKEVSGQMTEYTYSGYKIIYTIDPALQNWMNNEFKKYELPYAAAILVTVPKGEIKIMSGYSSSSPNLSFLELNLTPWAPAASLFKVVTATSLLQDAKISPELTECYHGGKHGLKPDLLQDNSEKDIHCIDFASAIAHSANVVTAKLAMKHLTVSNLLNMAYTYGFNNNLPFELPVKKSILKIDSEYKYALPYTAAGFGHVSISPFHAAWIMGIIANKGKTIPFHFVKKIYNNKQKVVPVQTPAPLQTKISINTTEQLTKILAKTVTEGTAKPAFFGKNGFPLLNISVAGKTGTLSRNKPVYLQYTWFAGFAPVEHPQVVFAVLVVNPLKWRTKAIFMAERMLLKYFSLNKHSQKNKIKKQNN